MPFAGEPSPQTAGSYLTITLDAVCGTALVEHPHLLPDQVRAHLTRVLGPGRDVACAVPAEVLSAPLATPAETATSPCVRLAGYWHDSLIEGPGRRSVAKLQGCPIRCRGCITPDSWDPDQGRLVPVDPLADALLDPHHARDGVTILGGEPMAQPAGVLALVWALRARGCRHILVYSGYTYEWLRRMAERQPAVGAILAEVEVLIDGPYVEALAEGAGPWTGSGNQRVIDLAATRRAGRLVLLEEGPGAKRCATPADRPVQHGCAPDHGQVSDR